tara:strand:- start:3306 stop:3464 length:159 start_codon:yes stop_codon:yes gene_type:complete
MIEQLRDGDVVVVTKYDRLSRSLQELKNYALVKGGSGWRGHFIFKHEADKGV